MTRSALRVATALGAKARFQEKDVIVAMDIQDPVEWLDYQNNMDWMFGLS